MVKGAHAEEKYLLIDILSGCVVKSYMSVTRVMAGWNTEDMYGSQTLGGVLRNEEGF